MLNLLNVYGDLDSESHKSRVDQIRDTARQHLECLSDSGATTEELKAYGLLLVDAVLGTVDDVVTERALVILNDEDEDEEAQD